MGYGRKSCLGWIALSSLQRLPIVDQDLVPLVLHIKIGYAVCILISQLTNVYFMYIMTFSRSSLVLTFY